MSIPYLEERIHEGDDQFKILFTGLDTAGKTSIILALQREFSKIAILKPTRGAQRRIFEFLGKQISEWDLGGQTAYRISYLRNPSKYFDNTEIAVFVIDIQNNERIPESLGYLKDVIDKFRELEIEPPIYVFFHKWDPGLERTIESEISDVVDKLKKDLKNLIEYDKIYYYKTSIYDLASIMFAISEVLLALYPKSELITRTIKEFSNKLNSEGIILLDDNSLIIGSYFKIEQARKLLTLSAPYFLTLNDSFQFDGERQIEDQIIVQRFGRHFLFKQIKLKAGYQPYYLLLIKEGQYFYKEDFDSLARLLREIIYK